MSGPFTEGINSTISLSSAGNSQILFGTLLKERRKKAGFSQRGLSEALGVTRNTIINWEADKSKPDYSLIPEICRLLDIRPYELFRMQPENGLTDEEKDLLNVYRQLSAVSQRIAKQIVLTILEEESAAKNAELKGLFRLFLQRPGSLAAGAGNEVPYEPPSYIFLRKNHINAKADGIALVKGHSMEPVYHNGDYVYYEGISAASPGEDVIVDTDEGAVIKRVGNDHTLYSVNPDYPYPKKNSQNTLVIRGRVLGVVASSDRAGKPEKAALMELFADEIREFNREYGIDE